LKIIFTATWPEGIVGIMVLAFVGLALFTMFFSWTHYVKTKARHFFTGIFIAIIPMAVLLLMAVGVRVSEYGVTESRYFVTLFGLIFIAISTYYLISRTKFNWKFVFMGVALIAIITTFGPWSAISVAKNSQLDRLESKLVDLNLIVNGKVVKPAEPIVYTYGKDDQYYSLIRDIGHFRRVYGNESVSHWFNSDISEMYNADLFENEMNIYSTYGQRKF